MRLISICPSNTELIHYLGATDWLVGVDDFSDWPAHIHSLPKLGPDLSIDLDAVEALQPDLVVASLSVPGMEKNIEGLKERGIPHLVLNPQSLDEIGQDLLTLGHAIGLGEQAEKVHHEYQSVLASFRETAASIDTPPTLYWEWWPKPVFTPGQINWLTEVSELAGGLNCFRDVELASVQTTWDDVAARNPDHICLAWVGVQLTKVNTSVVKKRPGWTELEAIRNDRLHVLEEELYCRPSPRLLEGIDRLGKRLHPKHYQSINLPSSFLS